MMCSHHFPPLQTLLYCLYHLSVGFGDVPPIRPLETLHNALSLRKLDSFLQDMIFAQIFKTPTGSPPRVHDAAAAVSTMLTVQGVSVSTSVQAATGLLDTASVNPADGSYMTVQGEKDSVVLPINTDTTTGRGTGGPVANESLDVNDVEMQRIMTAKKQRKFYSRATSIAWRK